MRRRQVVLIGASDEREHLPEAQEIGAAVASRGWVLVTGGRGGVMEAASRGAAEAGGTVIGILPGDDFAEANSYCTAVIPTGIGYARNSVNVLSGDAIVAIGGKSGTLSELAYAWQYQRPIIACLFAGGWGRRIAEEPIDDRRTGLVYPARDVPEVLRILDSLLGQ